MLSLYWSILAQEGRWWWGVPFMNQDSKLRVEEPAVLDGPEEATLARASLSSSMESSLPWAAHPLVVDASPSSKPTFSGFAQFI